jgi:hypothetical protein
MILSMLHVFIEAGHEFRMILDDLSHTDSLFQVSVAVLS